MKFYQTIIATSQTLKEEIFTFTYSQLNLLTCSNLTISIIIYLHIFQNILFYAFIQMNYSLLNLDQSLYMYLLQILQIFEPVNICLKLHMPFEVPIVLLLCLSGVNFIAYAYLKKNEKLSIAIKNILLHILSFVNICLLYVLFFVQIEFFLYSILDLDKIVLLIFSSIGLAIAIITQGTLVLLFFNESFQSNCFHSILCGKFQLFNMFIYKLLLALSYIVASRGNVEMGDIFIILLIICFLRLCHSLLFTNYMFTEVSKTYFTATCFEFHFLLALIFHNYVVGNFASLYFYCVLAFVHRIAHNIYDTLDEFLLNNETIAPHFQFMESKQYVALLNNFMIYESANDLSRETTFNGNTNYRRLRLNGFLVNHAYKCSDAECICPHLKNVENNNRKTLFYDGVSKASLNGSKIKEMILAHKNPLLHQVYMKSILLSFIESSKKTSNNIKARIHFNTYFLKNYYKGILYSLWYKENNKFLLDLSYSFAIYTSIRRGMQHFEEMNKNAAEDPEISKTDIKTIFWLEANFHTLRNEMATYLESLIHLSGLQNTTATIHNNEVLEMLSNMLKKKKIIKDLMETKLNKNIRSIKIYIPFLKYVMHQFKKSRSLTKEYEILGSKIENYNKRNINFYEAELVYDNNSGLVVAEATNQNLGHITYYNKGAQSIFQFNKDEIIGSNVKTLMPSIYSNHHDNFLKNYMKIGKENFLFRENVVVAQKKNGKCILCSILVKPNLVFESNTLQFMACIKRVKSKSNFILTDDKGSISALSGGLLKILSVDDAMKVCESRVNVVTLIPELSLVYDNTSHLEDNDFNNEFTDVRTKMYALRSTFDYINVQQGNILKTAMDHKVTKSQTLKKSEEYATHNIIYSIKKLVFNNNSITAFFITISKMELIKNKIKNTISSTKQISLTEISKPDNLTEMNNVAWTASKLTLSSRSQSKKILKAEYSSNDQSFDDDYFASQIDNEADSSIPKKKSKVYENSFKEQTLKSLNDIESVASVSYEQHHVKNMFKEELNRNKKSRLVINLWILLLFCLLLNFGLLIGINIKYIDFNRKIGAYIQTSLLPTQYFTRLESLYSNCLFYDQFYPEIYSNETLRGYLKIIVEDNYKNFRNKSITQFVKIEDFDPVLKKDLILELFQTENVYEEESEYRRLGSDEDSLFIDFIRQIKLATQQIIYSNLTANVSTNIIYDKEMMEFFDQKYNKFEFQYLDYILATTTLSTSVFYVFFVIGVDIFLLFFAMAFWVFNKTNQFLNNLIEIIFTFDHRDCKKFITNCQQICIATSDNYVAGRLAKDATNLSAKAENKMNKNYMKPTFIVYKQSYKKEFIISFVFLMLVVLIFVPYAIILERKKQERNKYDALKNSIVQTQIMITHLYFEAFRIVDEIKIEDDIDEIETDLFEDIHHCEVALEDFMNNVIYISLDDFSNLPKMILNDDFCSYYSQSLNYPCHEVGIFEYQQQLLGFIKEMVLSIASDTPDYILENPQYFLAISTTNLVIERGFEIIYAELTYEIQSLSKQFIINSISIFAAATITLFCGIAPLGNAYFFSPLNRKYNFMKDVLKIYPNSVLKNHKGLKVFIKRSMKQISIIKMLAKVIFFRVKFNYVP